MKTQCLHKWVERTATLRDMFKLSENGGWEVDCFKFFVCSYCYHIKTKPNIGFDVNGTQLKQNRVEIHDTVRRVA